MTGGGDNCKRIWLNVTQTYALVIAICHKKEEITRLFFCHVGFFIRVC